MTKKFLAIVMMICNVVLSPANGASEGVTLLEAPIDHYNFSSLQRGAKLYVNYCIGCHSLKYMRYSRMGEDLGISEEILTTNITFGEKLFAPMNSAMDAEMAKEWFNQALPPDLSVISRAKGADWIYSYLKAFYRDAERPSGWNNSVFENVAMPNVLHGLQGSHRYNKDGNLVQVSVGSMDPAEFDTVVADLVNFLVYVGEPVRNTRVRIGYGVMIFLSFLLVIVYMMYREYWREVE